ncbi:hypothetical protein [Aquimarina spongiae]|uniref:Uncharacterized protein n=1 Tax=Aquimarina spongiae TaxID=570521 RepID=A0A1M6D5I2_9FLAO|nr:hypothetical protein [Aquimarina spongiae]SHI68391.1 hypothetical protein SAMN04488508_102442 [Aquimarina spongiae]
MNHNQILNIEGIQVLQREQTKTIKGGAEDNMVCDWVGSEYICFDVIDVVA